MVSEHAESSKVDKIRAELRDRLRVLYRHNGEPSTREIARRTSKAISHTTANAVLRCEKIPRWGQLELVVEALGGNTDEFRQLWIAVRNAADQAETTELRPSEPSDSREVEFTATAHVKKTVDADRLPSQAPETPWTSDEFRNNLKTAEEMLGRRVIGQPNAIRQVVDALIRSAVGINEFDIQGRNHPRLVLFFAGPIGVGKLELAKALSQLLFGSSEGSYVRFHMTEFSSEDASDRMFGAPPGYVGYENGGELANLIRRDPFRVIVFDEIEKTHGRVLDKLLRMLQEGELADSHGHVSVADSAMIFTASIDIIDFDQRDQRGRRAQPISPDMPYPEIEGRYRAAVASHFIDQLGRPAFFHQIEKGLVIFDFIRPDATARAIADMHVKSILEQLKRNDFSVELSESATEDLYHLVARDLSRGGRGIGNDIEVILINPLARVLFERQLKPGQRLRILGFHEDGQGWHLDIE